MCWTLCQFGTFSYTSMYEKSQLKKRFYCTTTFDNWFDFMLGTRRLFQSKHKACIYASQSSSYVNGCGWIANDTGLAYVGLYSSTGTAITTDVPVSIIGSTTGTSVSFVTTLVYPDTTSSLSGYLLFRSASDPSLTYKRNVKY